MFERKIYDWMSIVLMHITAGHVPEILGERLDHVHFATCRLAARLIGQRETLRE